jgi:hypothetical protein
MPSLATSPSCNWARPGAWPGRRGPFVLLFHSTSLSPLAVAGVSSTGTKLGRVSYVLKKAFY